STHSSTRTSAGTVTGSRKSTSWRATTTPSLKPGSPAASAAVNIITTRASSSSTRYLLLFTCPKASMSDQRRATSVVKRLMSVPGELPVGDPVGLRRLGTETLDLVLLVRLEVALEPEPLRLAVLVEALPREDVGGDVVEEGAVVRDDHGAAGELQQRVLQARERLDVEVVGGLVEQEHIAALLEGERQVEPVALAAGEDLGGLLLVGALEAEGGDVGARGHLDLADHEVVQSVGDGLPDGLVPRQAGPVLVDVGDLDGAADVDLARVGLLEADDGLEQGRLADAVGADDPDDAVAREAEVQAVDELLAVEALDQVLDFDDGAAEARPRRDLDLLEVELAGLLGFGGHLLVAAESGLGLALASLGVRADPFELVPEALLELGVLAALHLHALGLLLQVGGVVALVRVGAAAVELEDPLGDVVEEVPVVRDGDDGA